MELFLYRASAVVSAEGMPQISPVYDVAFTAIVLLIVAASILAIVLLVRSPLSAAHTLLFIALTVAVPLLGAVVAVVVVSLVRRGYTVDVASNSEALNRS